MQIKFDANKKRLDTTPAFGLLVQGENLAESIQITGPKMVGALDLSQLRVAVRMTSQQYETTVEKTLEQTTDGDTITFTWQVDKQFTGSPGIVDVMLVGYGGNEEVIKITSSGMVVQEDKVFGTAPPESTWEQILQQMQDFATQAYESKTAAANSAAAAAASQKVAEEKAAQATNAANEAVKAAETAAADAAARAAAKTEQQIRQYADDRYARALQGTADPAASITIYPDAGSNVAATAHGFTKQEGSGDASPANVRKIINGGLKLVKAELSHTWNWTENNTGTWTTDYAMFYADDAGLPSAKGPNRYTVSTLAGITESEHIPAGSKPGVLFVTSGVYLRYKKSEIGTTASSCKAFIQKMAEIGNPIVAWYVPKNEDDTTGLYEPLSGIGGDYLGQCGKLTAPLCQGDKFITKVKSGCDMKVVLDGGVADGFTYLSQDASGSVWRILVRIPDVTDYNKGGFGFSDWVSYKTGWGSTEESFYCTDGGVFLFIKASSFEEAKSVLSQKPLTMWLHSTNYTDAADIPVSLEIHVRAVFTPDGTEPWKWDKSSGANVYRGVLSNVYPKAKSGFPMCSHAKSQTTYLNTNGVTCKGSTFTLAFPDIQMESGVDTFKEYLSSQYTGKTPITIVYELESPITYAHEPVDFIASPGEDGAWVITGEENGQVSAVYNKNLTHTIAELQAALLALGAQLSL